MRKFISLGISVLAVGSLALTAAPAQAAPSATTGVCNVLGGLDGLVASAASSLGLGSTALGVANADEAAKFGAVNTALSELVGSMVGYIQSVDSGVGTPSAYALFQEKLNVYSQKVSAWSTSNVKQFNAANTNDLNGLSNTLISGLNAGLCGLV